MVPPYTMAWTAISKCFSSIVHDWYVDDSYSTLTPVSYLGNPGNFEALKSTVLSPAFTAD
jgi:hypothetical protein